MNSAQAGHYGVFQDIEGQKTMDAYDTDLVGKSMVRTAPQSLSNDQKPSQGGSNIRARSSVSGGNVADERCEARRSPREKHI